jgi:hypothetical protein
MFDPTTSHYEGIKKEIKEEEKKGRQIDRIKKEKETGTPVVERLVARNYYFFSFYKAQ